MASAPESPRIEELTKQAKAKESEAEKSEKERKHKEREVERKDKERKLKEREKEKQRKKEAKEKEKARKQAEKDKPRKQAEKDKPKLNEKEESKKTKKLDHEGPSEKKRKRDKERRTRRAKASDYVLVRSYDGTESEGEYDDVDSIEGSPRTVLNHNEAIQHLEESVSSNLQSSLSSEGGETTPRMPVETITDAEKSEHFPSQDTREHEKMAAEPKKKARHHKKKSRKRSRSGKKPKEASHTEKVGSSERHAGDSSGNKADDSPAVLAEGVSQENCDEEDRAAKSESPDKNDKAMSWQCESKSTEDEAHTAIEELPSTIDANEGTISSHVAPEGVDDGPEDEVCQGEERCNETESTLNDLVIQEDSKEEERDSVVAEKKVFVPLRFALSPDTYVQEDVGINFDVWLVEGQSTKSKRASEWMDYTTQGKLHISQAVIDPGV